jgi:hypothetical protein
MLTTRCKSLSKCNLRLRCVVVAAGMLGLAACGGGSSGKPSAAQQTGSSTPASLTSSSGSASATLGAVDACTLLTPSDFAAATDKVQPSGFPASSYTLTTEKAQTDVSAATDQHAACTYHFSGHPGASGELTLDVMTSAEYHSLGTFETGKPVTGLGDEAAVYGERPAFLLGNRGALIANSSSSIAFGTELLRRLASHF